MKKLDLHGVKHQDVDLLVENFILMNQNEIPLTIICGNSMRMIELVRKVTDRLECEIYNPNYGTIVIRKL